MSSKILHILAGQMLDLAHVTIGIDKGDIQRLQKIDTLVSRLLF